MKLSPKRLRCALSANLRRPLLGLAGLLALIPAARADYTVCTDNGLNTGVTPFWSFIDSSASGAPWNMVVSNYAPESGDVMTNEKPNTQALRQFDSVTLSNTNDSVTFSLMVRTLANQTSSTNSLHFSLLNTATVLDGDIFSYTNDPIGDATGYTYTQPYNSTYPLAQRVTADAATTVGTGTTGVYVSDTSSHTVTLKLTRVSTGLQITTTIDTYSNTVIDTSPSTYTFNTFRIDTGGCQVDMDSPIVTSSVPRTVYTFTLPHGYVTSGGIFTSSNQPVRELWRKLSLAPGTYTESWNNTDNSGNPVAAGTYTFKVLYHNLSYTWEGVIGDTCSSFVGANQYRTLETSIGMAFDTAGNGFITFGYNEGLPGVYRFTTNPQAPTGALPADSGTVWNLIATDGTLLYKADVGGGFDANNNTFVQAQSVTTGSNVVLLSGTNTLLSNGTHYNSVIDLTTQITSPPVYDVNFVHAHRAVGLAVQRTGSYLAVAHNDPTTNVGSVRIFNKTSGALVNTIPVTAAGQCAFSPQGDLWIISGTSAFRYQAADLTSTTAAPVSSITGLSQPVAIAVSLNHEDFVCVADAGTSQQVKCFDHTGALEWTLGDLGGYPTNGPDVSNTRFWFQELRYNVPGSFLAFQPDDSLWVGDCGTCRALHFTWVAPNTPPTYKEQIAELPTILQMSVDPNNPTRVFSGNYEFQVDYSKPLQPGDPNVGTGNGSWKMVKNWYGGFPTYGSYDHYLSNIVTLTSGGNTRTYGVLRPLSGSRQIVELPATGPLRFTGVSNSTLSGSNIEADGTIRTLGGIPNALTYTQTIYEQSLTSITASNNPVWSAAVPVASMPCHLGTLEQVASAHLDPAATGGTGQGIHVPLTSSGLLVTYETVASSFTSTNTGLLVWSNPNTHLGTVVRKSGSTPAGTDFVWKDMAGALLTQPDGLGTFPDLRAAGGHDGITSYAEGRNVIAGYDGQYGKVSSQWMHFWDDGLFIGQFGTSSGVNPLDKGATTSVPGFAGNIGMMVLAKANGTDYLYCTDESIHSGIHRWRLDGAVNELSATGTTNATVNLGTGTAWTGTNYVINPGFEAESATYSLSYGVGYTLLPLGWQVDYGSDGSGVGAFYTEWTEVTGAKTTSVFAHSFPNRATIAKGSAFKVRAFQGLTGLPSGTYTLTAWVRSSGGQTTAQMYCKKVIYSGTMDYTTPIPTTSAWTQITISGITVTNGQAEIGFNVQGASGQYIDIDDVSFSH